MGLRPRGASGGLVLLRGCQGPFMGLRPPKRVCLPVGRWEREGVWPQIVAVAVKAHSWAFARRRRMPPALHLRLRPGGAAAL
jgi:uncharacterized protein (DUF2237 family)